MDAEDITGAAPAPQFAGDVTYNSDKASDAYTFIPTGELLYYQRMQTFHDDYYTPIYAITVGALCVINLFAWVWGGDAALIANIVAAFGISTLYIISNAVIRAYLMYKYWNSWRYRHTLIYTTVDTLSRWWRRWRDSGVAGAVAASLA